MNQPTTAPSRPTGVWRLVAQREMQTALRSKAFVISAAVLLLAVVATIVVSSLVAGRAQDRTVAVVDAAGQKAVAASSPIADQLRTNTSVSAERVADPAAADRAVRDGDVDAALLPTDDGYQIVGDDSVDTTLEQALRTAVAASVLDTNAQRQGVDLTQLQSGTQTSQRLLDPASKDAGLRQIASFVFVILFYVTALGFGMQIATSVTQEKESRVVEILAAAIPIRAMLWGKVIGYSILAVGQVVLLSVAGVITLLATGRSRELGIIAPAIGWYVVFFVLGFVALSSFWAAAGSLAARQQDLQSTTGPAQLVLFAPYLVAVAAGEGVRTVVSMVPIAATMLMPGRLAEGSVPLWQLLVALATTIAAAVLLVGLGARVYERTLLRTGRKLGFREALRTADQKETAAG